MKFSQSWDLRDLPIHRCDESSQGWGCASDFFWKFWFFDGIRIQTDFKTLYFWIYNIFGDSFSMKIWNFCTKIPQIHKILKISPTLRDCNFFYFWQMLIIFGASESTRSKFFIFDVLQKNLMFWIIFWFHQKTKKT